ncbi:amino acid adenylation domain-containing protein, partial [Algoriphagus sp. 4150]|uniref:AMP-binding protein n=1 Tax=Algoriphagus sp. 4150 TaxID=2817756 RepID=UPI00285F332A
MGQGKWNRREIAISESQRRFFLEWALRPSEISYNVSYVNKLTGKIDKSYLKRSCEVFIQQAEIVHSQFSEDGEKCYHGNFQIDDFYHELTFDSLASVEEQVKSVIYVPFDLMKGPLLRFNVATRKVSDVDEFYFFFVAHHVICDAAWVSQFYRMLERIYNSLCNGKKASYDFVPAFSNAVTEERDVLTKSYKVHARRFWLDFISDMPLKVNLPYRQNIDGKQANNVLADQTGEFIYFELNSSQTEQLRSICRRRRNHTLFIVLSALYGLVLSKFLNHKKFCISYTVNTRPKGFGDVLGCFVNNIPMKFDIDSITTLEDLIEYLAAQRKEVIPFQGYSLTDIIGDQRRINQVDINSVFNVGFSQSYLNVAALELMDLKADRLDIAWSKNSIYELGLLYDDTPPENIYFKLEYRKNLFLPDVIQEFINVYKHAVNEYIDNLDIDIKKNIGLSSERYNRIVYEWNNTEKVFPLNVTIQEIFSRRAAQVPHQIAVTYNEIDLTYRELEEKSNQLARYIRREFNKRAQTEIVPDTIIPVCLERSVEMVVGIIAVLKAGASYVPIDPNFPRERIEYILSDTHGVLVVTQRHLCDGVKLPEDKVICMDLTENLYIDEDLSPLPLYNISSDLAYVLYTSGTTGRPKGVMVEHVSFIQLCYADSHNIPCKNGVLWTNYTFDVSVYEIFNTLFHGGRLLVVSDEVRYSSEKLFCFLSRYQVDYCYIPPFFIRDLVNFLSINSLPHLFRIVTGVENVYASDANKIVSKNIYVLNGYGPTETTMCSIAYLLDKQVFEFPNQLPIGRPLSNEKAYILDQHGVPVPVGVTGELYIGGAGVARGYLN